MIGWFSRHVIGIVPVARLKAGTRRDRPGPGPRGPGGRRDRGGVSRGHAGRRRRAGPAEERRRPPGPRPSRGPGHAGLDPGAGRVLPKGEASPAPLNCAVLVGEPLDWDGDRHVFMARLRAALLALKDQAPPCAGVAQVRRQAGPAAQRPSAR